MRWNSTTGPRMRQPSLPFSGRTPHARACSLAGALDAQPRSGTQAYRVLAIIREAGRVGVTDWELHALAGLERTTICARRNALLDAGLVREDGTRAAGPWHRQCTVWVATGRAA
jgi:hypothetical protein